MTKDDILRLVLEERSRQPAEPCVADVATVRRDRR